MRDGRAVGAYRATGYVPQVLVRLAAAGHPVHEAVFTAGELGGDIAEVLNDLDIGGAGSGPDLFNPLLGGDDDA